jgi:hypothetical protein
MNSRPHVLDGQSPEPHPHYPDEDVCVDMQYAKHNCKDPMLFVARPWEHCKDPTSTFLGLRFAKRDEFKLNLTPTESKRVEHEEQRIRETRAKFSSYGRKKEWKREVTTKLNNYAEGKEPMYPKSWIRDQAIDHALIERVKSWTVDDVVNEPTPAPHLEAEYEFKACAIYFKRLESGSGWERYTHTNEHFLPGKFPSQKISVHSILEKKAGNPLSEKCPPDRLRYFHFPANNMRWIEVCSIPLR